MTLYHGSYKEIKVPDLKHSRKNVDFGPGFYATSIYDQAMRWSSKFHRRGLDSVVSIYQLEDGSIDKLSVLQFDSYSEEWLDFVLTCRSGHDKTEYDLVVGGVANDKVFNTIELYYDGLIDKTEAIRRLRFEKPSMQICFRSEKSLLYLRFERSVTL